MLFFFKKQKSIIMKIEKYLSCIDSCRDKFKKCMDGLINEIDPAKYNELTLSVHTAESQADDLKREIEYDLYQKALVPESRGDILGILESLDKVPNIFESICYQVHLQKIIIPQEYRKEFFKLIEVNIEAYNKLREITIGLFYEKSLIEDIRDIDVKESESDKIERNLIKKIFDSTIDKADKILLREIVINIGHISNRAQVVGDRLALAIIKRRI